MTITIETTVAASVATAWQAWTSPAAITQWNFASPDWSCPRAELDLRPGGKFKYRMEAKDGSFGFDFEGEFTAVIPNQKLEYSLGDDRKVSVDFIAEGGATRIVESFQAEDAHAGEAQRQGWLAILHNFKKFVDGR
ncbi:hypothetical protein Verru16b_03056 [Lacunisphaera limnophila]|uniref:Activator of Hsp90 ATPase homologue 1/2-like C-terminal domain-containing protein n=1 Tax=Lacunisphaera limnophila TaxID=1838286 RepID=A0A1D8AYM1_9BACT|nr:SRPBCC domain-containing protein [Lacunisphaera limnophila]AOS45965.1 hypothetical protein Verru16b_03056 [Lacunisphaera limnophila]